MGFVPDLRAQSAGRNNSSVLAAFKDIVAKPSESTVRVLNGDKDAALGTIVSQDGYIVTKGSQLKGNIICKLKDGRSFPAKYIGLNDQYDLALLKIEASGLKPIVWHSSKEAEVGNWLATPGLGIDPVAVGVVSVATRKTTPRDFPRRAPPPNSGFLGILLREGDGAPVVSNVEGGSAAEKAGLKSGDMIVAVSGRKVTTPDALIITIQKYKVGEEVVLRVKRGKDEKDLTAKLGKRPESLNVMDRAEQMNRMGSELSDRRTGFPVILQHDTVIKPTECGGPIVDLEGKAVGINIARAGRIESYALPSETVQTLFVDLKSGKYPPPPSEDEIKLASLTRKLEGLRKDLLAAEDEMRSLKKTETSNEEDELALELKKKAVEKKVGGLRDQIQEARSEADRIRKDRTKK